jgi:uncharacterized protein YneF (UPF0154 family)
MAKNNNSLVWWIVFIVLALIVGYLIGTSVTGNIIRNPYSTKQSPASESGSTGMMYSTIAANSCDADSTCEVNSLGSKGPGKFYQTLAIYSNSSYSFFKAHDDVDSLEINVGKSGYGSGKLVLKAANIVFYNLTGSGNAYLCIDSQGVMFRKTTPCV